MTLSIGGATEADVPQLAQMNKRLIEDEGSRNPMSLSKLEQRLLGWLRDGWRADLVLDGEAPIGYTVYQLRRDEHDPTLPEVYVRQFFIERTHRGRGLGTEAFRLLERERFPRPCRVELDVLGGNPRGHTFWQRLGFRTHVIVLERFLNPGG